MCDCNHYFQEFKIGVLLATLILATLILATLILATLILATLINIQRCKEKNIIHIPLDYIFYTYNDNIFFVMFYNFSKFFVMFCNFSYIFYNKFN